MRLRILDGIVDGSRPLALALTDPPHCRAFEEGKKGTI